MKSKILGIILCLSLISCDEKNSEDPFALYKNPTGIDFSGFDQNTRPQDDLYQYVNGGWMEKTKIPGDQSSFGVLGALREVRDERVNDFLEEFSIKNSKTIGSDEQILGDLFYSLKEDDLVEGSGFKPIGFILEEIERIENKDQLQNYLAKNLTSNIRLPFTFEVRANFKDSTKNILSFFQSSQGMPGKEYYLSEDKNFEDIRGKYREYLRTILTRADLVAVAKRAENALKIESLLAEIQWSNADRRDPVKISNHFIPENLKNLTKKLNWETYLEALGANNEEVVNVSELSFFVALGDLIERQPLEIWKDYLRVRVLDGFARYLETDIRTAYYAFHDGVIRGLDEIRSRNDIAVFTVNNIVGDAVGKVYAERFFPASSKKRMEELTSNLKASMKELIQNNSWMAPETKSKAIIKLENLLTEIGYPMKWVDYSNLEINRETPVSNIQNIYDFYYSQNLSKLGKPVKRNAWRMAPHVVNAYFLPFQNAMFYPAAFLEPPYFNPEADDAVNYAGIGVIIGHEIGHGFDDQGSQFGPTGTLENWWTEEDLENFKKESGALVELFNSYSPIEGMTVNGSLTLGENIGDLVGVQIAYNAYMKSLKGNDTLVLRNLTSPQRFFIGYAQSVRSKAREEAIRGWLVSDPHSPDEYRVNGIVIHIPAFYDAFDIKEEDGMYLPPDQRVSIW